MTDDKAQQAIQEFSEQLAVSRATLRASMAAFEVARAKYLDSPNPTFHRYVSAKMDYDYRIVNFTIADVALAGYDNAELSEIVTDVLRRSARHMRAALNEASEALGETCLSGLADLREGISGTRSFESTAPKRIPEPKVYEETSIDGEIRLALNFGGAFAFCHIGPAALDTHEAPFLAERIVRLHRKALMPAKRDVEAFLRGDPLTK